MSDWTPGPAWLFCPADRPDRYPKALAVADVVILDLEDAVAPACKHSAREAVRHLAKTGSLDNQRTVVRINGPTTGDHAEDIRLLAELNVHRVMLAKAEHPQQLSAIEASVIPLVETPCGVEWAGELSETRNVIGMMWGADDLVAGMGGTSSRRGDGAYRDIARYARSRVLMAAKACDRLALDAVHMDINDVDGLAAESADAVAVGFDASIAIHPRQVEVIRSAYRPSPEQIEWARRLLAHVGDDRGVTSFEGRMVDGPIFKQAERLLGLAAATGASAPATETLEKVGIGKD